MNKTTTSFSADDIHMRKKFTMNNVLGNILLSFSQLGSWKTTSTNLAVTERCWWNEPLLSCVDRLLHFLQILCWNSNQNIHNKLLHHGCLTAPCRGLPGWAVWILLKQETVSGSGISWAICKSAPHSRQITKPLSFYRPDALPAAQPTASKHWSITATQRRWNIRKNGQVYRLR